MVQRIASSVPVEQVASLSTLTSAEEMTSGKKWIVSLQLAGALFGGLFLLVLAWACDPSSWETVSR